MSYSLAAKKLSSYIQTMLCILCTLHSMFHMACGCVAEERIALMHVRSSLVKADSIVPDSWGQSGDCCSWERVTCDGKVPRVSGLDLSSMYAPQGNSITGSECWKLNLTVFSLFRQLQLLDLSWNHACLQNLDGMYSLYFYTCRIRFVLNQIWQTLTKLIERKK